MLVTILHQSIPSLKKSFESTSDDQYDDMNRFIDDSFFAPHLNSIVPLLLIIEDWETSFTPHLQKHFPDFRPQLLDVFRPGSPQNILPLFVDGLVRDFAINHVDLRLRRKTPDGHRQGERITDLTQANIPVVASFHRKSGVQVVLLIGNRTTLDFTKLLTDHYTGRSGEDDPFRRWVRLGADFRWLIPDLFFCFTDWGPVLQFMRYHIRCSERRGYRNEEQVTVRTKALHRQMAAVIALAEILRFHQAVVNHALEESAMGAHTSLGGHLQRMHRQMSHNLTTFDILKDQLANSIQLDFNLAAATQSQSLSRLTKLAFAYVPLTYVATIFTLPNLNADPWLYPVIAVPVLGMTLVLAAVMAKYEQLFPDERRLAKGAGGSGGELEGVPAFPELRPKGLLDLSSSLLVQRQSNTTQQREPPPSTAFSNRPPHPNRPPPPPPPPPPSLPISVAVPAVLDNAPPFSRPSERVYLELDNASLFSALLA